MGRSTVVTRLPLVALIVALFLVLAARTARAEEPSPRARAAELHATAEAADAALELATALSRYEAAAALDPSSPRAPRALARADELRRHAEGGFAPYAMLERVRRDPKQASDPGAIDALVSASLGFPPGLVRIEVWVLAAEAYARRLDRPDDAIRLYRKIMAEPGVDDVTANNAARDLVELHLSRGEIERASEAVKSLGARGDPRLVKKVKRLVRRRSMHFACIGVVGATLLAFGVVLARGDRTKMMAAVRAIAPLAIGFAAYVGVTGAVLASTFEEGTSKPFLRYALVVVPLVALARAWGAVGAHGAKARALRAAVCASAAMASGFLVLESVDPTYLDGLGL